MKKILISTLLGMLSMGALYVYLLDNIPDRQIVSYAVPLSNEYLYIAKVNAFESCKKEDSIEALDPSIRMMAWTLIERAKRRGYHIFLQETYRSQCRQNFLHEKGLTPTLDSLHTQRIAFDIAFWRNGKANWASDHPWKEVGEIGKELGFKWGGDFPTYNDYIHFEKADENGDFIQKIVRKD